MNGICSGRMKFRAAAHRIDAQLVGRVIHQPLDAVDQLRTPGAAIGVDWHGVGEHALHAVAQHLHVVDPRQHLQGGAGRDVGRVGEVVGAHVGDQVDLRPRMR